ncbi:MAG TPA: LysM peptidoglycan-binding domain-containing protein [Nitrospirota bacterium]|nr:LysM peptidoglycan-binding domain-containing protein [Nitrospirota bacterium]
MTTRLSALIQAACISLLIMLVPGTAAPQEQKEPSSGQQPEQTVSEPAQPQSEPTGTASGTTGGSRQLQAAPQKEEPQATTPTAQNATPTSEGNAEYVIKQGDTLWDISNTYLKDPFLWPIIWKANPSIANPDMIYAGNKLAIPSLAPLERAMQTPSEETLKTQLVEKQASAREEAKQTAEAAVSPAPAAGEGRESAFAMRPQQVQPAEETGGGNRLILPEEQPKPIIDKYAMLSAGFVNDVESADVIIGSAGAEKAVFGYGDSVLVKFGSPGNVNVGDKFLIYTSQGTVKHPRTGKNYGQLIHGLGILQVTAKDPSAEVGTARITLSFDTIEKNDQLTPYQEPVPIYPSPAKKKDISGYILAVTAQRVIVGQMDFVYLDKGSADGVDPGDNFIVYADSAKGGDLREKIGEVQVFLVKEHSSTAIVRKSTDTLTSGNAVDFKN